MKRKDFEKLVDEAVRAIPKQSLEKIKNVAILAQDEPTRAQLRKYHVPKGWTLFGVYEGIPLTARDTNYGVGETLPDCIIIFQKPIEQEAGGVAEKIKNITRETVLHEIGHYFGMDEREVRQWERARFKKKK